MRSICICLFMTFFMGSSIESNAQKISSADLKQLRLMDDSLKNVGIKILDDPQPASRLRSDSFFTRILVRALKTPYSYYFGFDSLQTAPIVYPEDSSFRIITWHYTPDDNIYHQRGVIQMNTPDGSLKIFPLYDYSRFTDAPEDSVRTPTNWIGAVYYKVVQKGTGDQKAYTLLGYDENNMRTTRKWMEILKFNEKGEPRFGGSIILPADSTHPQPRMLRRYLMEYKKETSAKLNYDEDEDLIIMDHLVSENNQPEKRYTLVPGGDYEGFKWSNGSWLNQPMLYIENRGENNEPRPATFLNEDGSFDDNKMMETSEKNMGVKTKKDSTTKEKAPVKKKKKG